MMEGTKPDKGWAWAVLIASLGIHIVNGCFLYCMGIIHHALLEHFDESVTLTSWTGSLVLGLISSTGPLCSFLMNKYSCRVTTMIGGVLLTTGCFVAAFMPSLNWVILVFGFIGGIGSGLTYVTSVVVVGLNFEKKRTVASGIAVSGCAAGTFIFPPFLTLAELNYGYRGLFIVLAAISFHMCLFGAMLRPSYLELQRKKEKSEEKTTNSISTVKRYLLPYLKVLRKKSVLAMCVSTFSFGIGVYLIFLHFPHYVILKKTSPLDASYLLMVAGICGTISRVLTGIVGNFDRVPEILLYCGSFGILGISTLLLPLYAFSYYGQVFYALTLGLFSGNCYTLFNAINVQLVGIGNLPLAYGMEMFFCGIGSTLGPILAGVIVDGGGTYDQSFLCAGSALSISAITGVLAQCMNKTERKMEDIENAGPYVIDVDKIQTRL